MKRVIVLVMDGLRASWLGPMGNTWFDTPVCNQLAAESLIFPNCFAVGADLATIYKGFWRGADFESAPTAPLAEQLAESRVPTLLVSDAPKVLDLSVASTFQHTIEPPDNAVPQGLADDWASTSTSVLLGAAMQSLSDANSASYLCWIHASFLAGAWDAPRAFREEAALREDVEPSGWSAPPQWSQSDRMSEAVDPDMRVEWLCAAAAQVQAWEHGLAWLMEFADQQEALLVVTGARGFPLGEHGVVGLKQPLLYEELLHVPLLARFPQGDCASQRDFRFVQSSHLPTLVTDWLELAETASQAPSRSTVGSEALLPAAAEQLAVARCGPQWGVRTAAWYGGIHSERDFCLFSKPDDQFELNEVADRCGEETQAMRELVEHLRQHWGTKQARCPLHESLWNPVR